MNISIHIDGKSILRAGMILAPLAMIGMVGMASAEQIVFEPGQVLTAEDLNNNFDEIPTITEWVPFTPVLTVNGTNIPVTTVDGNTKIGLWRRVGDSVEVMIDASVTCSNAGFFSWSLPNGLTIDSERSLLYSAIGSGFVVNGQAFTHVVRSVFTLSDTEVGMPDDTYSTNVGCADLGNTGGHVRMRYSVAVEGWGVSN